MMFMFSHLYKREHISRRRVEKLFVSLNGIEKVIATVLSFDIRLFDRRRAVGENIILSYTLLGFSHNSKVDKRGTCVFA